MLEHPCSSARRNSLMAGDVLQLIAHFLHKACHPFARLLDCLAKLGVVREGGLFQLVLVLGLAPQLIPLRPPNWLISVGLVHRYITVGLPGIKFHLVHKTTEGVHCPNMTLIQKLQATFK